MNKEELNNYILSYINSGRENALFLDGEWGVGKTYYLNESLIKFLNENQIKDIILLSLYGVENIFEISKRIYFEKKLKNVYKNKINELGIPKLIGKTVINGVLSFYNINLNLSEKDFEKLIKNIDLSHTFIIFDDIERTKLDINTLFGFINNLVIEDRSKVLIVGNERELVNNFNEIELKKYKKIKEKTIFDTISFNFNIKESIESILKSFKDECLKNIFNHKENLADIIYSIDIMKNNIIDCVNLRSFKNACFQYIEIFNSNFKKFDNTFLLDTFLSLVSFNLKKSKDSSLVWDEDEIENYSTKLGSFKYPLNKIIYGFVVEHNFNYNDLINENNNYIFSKNNEIKDKQIKEIYDVLYNYWVVSENELDKCICNLKIKINENQINTSEFYKIENYLVNIKYEIGFENQIDDLTKTMINQIENEYNENKNIVFNMNSDVVIFDKKAKEEFENFKSEIRYLYKKHRKLYFSIEDLLDKDLASYCNNLKTNEGFFLEDKKFIDLLDLDNLIEIIKSSSAKEIDCIRGVFLSIYTSYNINRLCKDKNKLIDFKNRLGNLENYNDFDKVQKLQMKYFLGNLNDIIKKFEDL